MTSINGLNASTSAQGATSGIANSATNMDSEAFLQMLLVQLNYQDPTAPMDSQQIVSQLADLTSVTAMGELQSSVQDLSGQLYSSQALYASTLVGQEIMVLANVMDIEAGESINGEILLTTAADDLKVEIYNGADELVATLPMGEQMKSGAVEFDMTDLEDDLPAGKYTLKAVATIDGKDMEAAITQRSNVTSVVIPGPGQEVLVEVDKVGLVPLSYITKLQGEAGSESQSNPNVRMISHDQGNGAMEANSFFNRELLRRYPGLHESGLVETTSANTLTDSNLLSNSMPAIPLGPASLAVARQY
ncbi:flagellar hook assembly protein FlgD [Parendozoicomonas haliclonae]|uniref:Basal-body rod modification protein FlgD n=1 Tax=Parendozoicomonas haliclonae TaxID=1960125 RepID=A0A1X7ANF0_9GAMM|nr:flagellar hook capping FlgD N-terminal domain-containing protein [Parendozoicomonas haliclonae]SMA49652.1 Basal-body rod modification protein FlgD [Parendozoicomonas haliclonae]